MLRYLMAKSMLLVKFMLLFQWKKMLAYLMAKLMVLVKFMLLFQWKKMLANEISITFTGRWCYNNLSIYIGKTLLRKCIESRGGLLMLRGSIGGTPALPLHLRQGISLATLMQTGSDSLPISKGKSTRKTDS